MITNQDILKLAKVLATKEDIRELDERLCKVEHQLNFHTIAIDKLTLKVGNVEQEQKITNYRLDKHEKWFSNIAEKIDVELEN